MPEFFGDDLVLLEKLAAGGMAEVFRGKQLGYGGFEKTVAIKRILQNYASNEEFKQMFRNEANLCAQLQNSNIVHVFGNGEHEGYLYLLMEFVDGKNVRQVLARADRKKTRIPIEISCYTVCEAAKGLEYAHNFSDEKTGQPLEIVHRDMSPQNIMVGYDGGIKIVDFGIAKAAARSGHTKAGVLKGKFGYMSPEQASGMNIDRRTDIFALGIILFELLTQRRLFTSDDDLKTLQLVKDCRIPRPSKYNPDITPALDNIVLKALKRERAERYSHAAEFQAELTQFLNQTYPKFVSSDLSKFVKGIFSDDILEERKKREKMNAEVPKRVDKEKKRESLASARAARAAQEPDSQSGLTEIDRERETNSSAETTNQDPRARERPAPQADYGIPNASSIVLENIDRQPIQLQIKKEQESELPSPTRRVTNSQLSQKKNKVSPMAFVAGVVILVAAAVSFIMPSKTRRGEVSRADRSDHSELSDSAKDEGTGAPLANNPSAVDDRTVASGSPASPVEDSTKISIDSIPKPARDGLVTEVKEPPYDANRARRPTSLPPAKQVPKFTGFLNLTSLPPATEIYVNGEILKNDGGQILRTPLGRYSLSTGIYSMVLKNTFYGVQWSGRVEIQKDKIVNVDVVLK